MTLKLTNYINLNGNAAEALDFYHAIFGGTVERDTFGEFNEASSGAMPYDEQDKDKIMHAALTGELVELMVSDYPSSWQNIPSESNIVLTLSVDDENTLRAYWEQLRVDGVVQMPLEQAPWGDTFGSVTDKLGVTWMVDISSSAA